MLLYKISLIICTILLCLLTPPVEAAENQTPPVPSSVAIATYYFDLRDFNTLNVLTSKKNLPGGLNIWGFTDFHGNHAAADQRFDLTRYFMEYRLRKPLDPQWMGGLKGLGVELEYNDGSGTGKNLLRLGLTYMHNIPVSAKGKSWLQWRVLPYETDESGQQLSLIHKLSLAERLSLVGFTDFHLNKTGPNRWVTESQLSYTINQTINAVFEARYNGFEDANPTIDGFGLALGLEIRP
ncbi:MAG: hypothetical protein HOI20_09270 [Gemmatimonadetes bacterium]|nr:hypothetical protein [Rhodospirillaceae bacterium]MBT5801775.1 hypothetical protein [Gemmatimonadota bacterium]MBT6902964.1 hypothetical protein [Gemmatimonadota bacterium]